MNFNQSNRLHKIEIEHLFYKFQQMSQTLEDSKISFGYTRRVFSTDHFLIELLKKFKVLPGRILAKARLTKQTFEPLASHVLIGIRTIV